MDFYIYILHSATFDKFYRAHSENPWKRVEEHNSGIHHKFTSHFRPWRLAAVFRVEEERGFAMKIEKFIKKQKSRIASVGKKRRNKFD